MEKKGISPLIATVLIIGFVIALAVIILTWSQTFTERLTETTELSVEEGQECLQNVNIKIRSVCYNTEDFKIIVQIENQARAPLSNFIFRVFYTDKTVDMYDDEILGTLPLEGFDIDVFNSPYDDNDGERIPEKLEVLPKLTLESGKEITCSRKLDSEYIYSICAA